MKITNAKDTRKRGITVLLYGESGTGKTSTAKTLKGKTLLIDVEGGASVLAGHNIDIATVDHTLDGLKQTVEEAVLNENKYENVVFDSSSELQSLMLIRMAELGKIGVPSVADYGVVSYKMRDYIRKLRDMCDNGVNVIVTALETSIEIEHNEEEVKTKIYPLMLKKLAPEICGLFEVVARMEVSTKKGFEGQRFFRLDGDDKIMAKNRLCSGVPFCKADFSELFALRDKPPAKKIEPQEDGNSDTKTTAKRDK